jgi:DNA-binding transcriptional regulator GbsR (MarR family)
MGQQEELRPVGVPAADEAQLLSRGYQEALERFILFWGEMASNWGINRTMAQIHALLYASEIPLDTDEIMERLQISRGNANMNLRSLMNWNLAKKVHQAGSRKDFYTAEKDVWRITMQIVRERERREIMPVRQQLETCRDLVAGGADSGGPLAPGEQYFYDRIEKLMKLIEVFEGFSQALLHFIQEENAPVIKELIGFAQDLQNEEEAASREDSGAS